MMLALMGLTSSLVEVTKVQNMKVHKRIVNESAIQSTFGEYSKILQSTYGILSLDGSYMQNEYSEGNILERYEYYGGSVEGVEIQTLQLLSDKEAVGLKEQIISYMENQYGLDYIENIIGDLGSWEELDLGEVSSGEGFTQGSEPLDELNLALENSQEEGASEILKDFKGFDLDVVFSLVTKNLEVSESNVEVSTLPSKRELRQGYGDSYTRNYNAITEKAFLVEYAERVFPSIQSYVHDQQDSIELVENRTDELKYQIEYLLVGKGEDKDNLQAVIHKLLLLRTPINYTCLNTDSVKKAEARVLATTLSIATGGTVPQEAIYQTLL